MLPRPALRVPQVLGRIEICSREEALEIGDLEEKTVVCVVWARGYRQGPIREDHDVKPIQGFMVQPIDLESMRGALDAGFKRLEVIIAYN